MASPDDQKLADLVNNLASLIQILHINRSISKHVQNPDDHILATAFSINLFIPVRTCTELGVFTLLSSASPNPLTSAAIVEAVHAEELLIVRFMRAVCALDFADEATGSPGHVYR
ncbi:hypothetical protein PV05_08773 [Exophiala xenobiotica]|uniref:O-methyltransferase dimerisation domain-containing protein n=1 Tax=Exophiala xenobiotica TaxID=348802 RepID=A0A0D2BKY8_9EURO|nr:uncharacterized protein PV05_08773 [Exophiala xenobiotica]KIW53181.1 hypothetical protein PV05_08773 [Exophiala xenobiotica]